MEIKFTAAELPIEHEKAVPDWIRFSPIRVKRMYFLIPAALPTGTVLWTVQKLKCLEKYVRKSASEKELLLVRMGVRKITFFIKGA
jgi:hypothetical protein